MLTIQLYAEDLFGRRPLSEYVEPFAGRTLAELAPPGASLVLYAGEVLDANNPRWRVDVPVDGAVLRFASVPHGDAVGDIGEVVGGIVNPHGIILDTILGEGGRVGDFLRGLVPDFIRQSPFANLGGMLGGFFGGGNMASLGSSAPIGGGDSSPSPTYSFGTIGNVFSDGAPVPIVYGEHRVGGAVIHLESFVDRDGELLMYTILLGEGPFEKIGKWTTDQNDLFSDGDPNGNHAGLYLNDRPAWTIPNIYMSLRLGTASQAPSLPTVAQRYGYGLVLDQGILFKHETARPVNGVRLIFRAPGGLYRISQETGEKEWQEARFEITFFDESGANVPSLTRNVTLADNGSVAPYWFQADILSVPYGRYTVQARRLGAQEYTSATNVADKVELYVLMEFGFSQPNYKHRATLTVKVRASQDLSGFPQTTIVVRGRKVLNTDTATTAWTRNPAWIIRDLMTFARGGLGSRIVEAELDEDSFADFAADCDELIPSYSGAPVASPLVRTTGTGAGPTVAGTWSSSTKWGRFLVEVTSFSAGVSVGLRWTFYPAPELNLAAEVYNTTHTSGTAQAVAYGVTGVASPAGSWPVGSAWEFDVLREPRYRLDVVLDQRRSGWRWVQDLAATARASVARIGNKYVVIRGNQRLPVALFVESANIARDSLQISSESTSQRDNTVEVQFLDAADNFRQASETIESETVALGLEEQRRAVYQMPGVTRRSQAARMAAFYVRLMRLSRLTFGFEAGIDALGVYPGQVVKVVANRELYAKSGRVVSGTVSTVTLDREVTLRAGRAYRYSERTQANEFEEVDFTVASDTTSATINVAPFDASPTGNPWSICEVGEEGYLVLVTRVTATADLGRSIEGALYLDEIYSDDGNPTGFGQAVPVAPTAPDHVTDLAVVETVEADTLRSVLTLSWTAAAGPPDTHRVWVKLEGASDFSLVDSLGSTATGYVYRALLPFGSTVTFRVQTANGPTAADFDTAPEVVHTIENDAGSLVTIPAAPATFTATPGSGNDVTLAWASVSGADGYEVRVGSWSNGAVVYRGASLSVGIKATRLATRYLVRAFTGAVYSRDCRTASTAATALSGYSTLSATYNSTLDDLAAAGALAIPWHVKGRGIALVVDSTTVVLTSPQTDLGSSAATHVSLAFRAVAVPYVAANAFGTFPFYFSGEGDNDVRLVLAPVVLQHSTDGTTWTDVAFEDAARANLNNGADVVVTARYFRFRVSLSSLAVLDRASGTVFERRAVPLVEQLDAAFYRA